MNLGAFRKTVTDFRDGRHEILTLSRASAKFHIFSYL